MPLSTAPGSEAGEIGMGFPIVIVNCSAVLSNLVESTTVTENCEDPVTVGVPDKAPDDEGAVVRDHSSLVPGSLREGRVIVTFCDYFNVSKGRPAVQGTTEED